MSELKILSRGHQEIRYMPVSGATGGVAPYGAVLVALFHEHMELPDATMVEMRGTIATEQPASPRPPVRDYLFGMQLTREQAWALGMWLQEQAKLAGFSPPEGGIPTQTQKWN